MSQLSIRITDRPGTNERVLDITLPAPAPELIRGELVELDSQFARAAWPLNELVGALEVLTERDRCRALSEIGIVLNRVTSAARFVKLDASGNATESASWAAVHDTHTGLIWSKGNVASSRLTYADAKTACAALDLAGSREWRLPTRTELESLLDLSRHEPAIDTDYFPGTHNAYYWTSTPCAWRAGSASWCVAFGYGDVGGNGHGNECFVRAVRSASPAAGQ